MVQQIQISFRAGEDYTQTLTLSPRQSVVGWTVQFIMKSSNVTFTFPPITIFPGNPLGWPNPLAFVSDPSVPNVVPGVQPLLPTSGGVVTVVKNNDINDNDDGGVCVADVTNGVFNVVFASADTELLAPDTFWWQLKRIDSGQKQTLFEGSLYLLPSKG